ncbi:MAG: hypothetical protein IKQ91_04900, partial [Oscillospiraceae bacterium]|nr:hypothetical protein [Oscillospiraceae bacterium]
EKMYGILPVTRKEIAASRYLLLTGILTGLLVLYLLIAAVTDFGGLPGSVLASELRNLSSAVELKPDPSALFRTDLLLNGAGFLISAAVLARKLRRYFRSFGSGMKKQKKFPLLRKLLSMIGIVIVLEAFLLFVLFGGRFSSVLGRFISMAMHFLSTVSEILNGSLLFVCLLTVGFCAAAYQYVCAYLEFEQKDI